MICPRCDSEDTNHALYGVVSCYNCGAEFAPKPERELHIEITSLRDKANRLRDALIGLVGSEDPRELREMKKSLDLMPIPQEERAKTVNAIDALLEGK